MTLQCLVELPTLLDERLYITGCRVTSPEQVTAYCVCRHMLEKRNELVPVQMWKRVHLFSAVFLTVSCLHFCVCRERRFRTRERGGTAIKKRAGVFPIEPSLYVFHVAVVVATP